MPRSRKSLTRELAELEQSDSVVGAAAERYDETISRLLGRSRIDKFRNHREGGCRPSICEYRHTREERENDRSAGG